MKGRPQGMSQHDVIEPTGHKMLQYVPVLHVSQLRHYKQAVKYLYLPSPARGRSNVAIYLCHVCTTTP